MGQIVGLKSIHVGAPIANGITEAIKTDAANFEAIKQPYQGGVTTNFSMPSTTELFREGETSPFWAAVDATSASKKLTWEVVDFDEKTLEFYFGTNEVENGTIYEGVNSFIFDSNSGMSLAFARLKYVAILTGSFNATEPLRISVEATVLAPENGGKAWWPITTPSYAKVDE